MTIEIRKAGDADKDALKAISRRTISANYRAFLGGDAVDQFIGEGAADRYVEDCIGDCSVILADGEIVGFCVCKASLIDLVMIDHASHRQGLGSRLLADSETRLFETYDQLALESFAQNGKANAFYKKTGWKESKSYFDEAAGANKIVFTKTAPLQ